MQDNESNIPNKISKKKKWSFYLRFLWVWSAYDFIVQVK